MTNSSGNIFVTGEPYVDLDENTNAGHSDSFVVKYDTDGNKNQSNQYIRLLLPLLRLLQIQNSAIPHNFWFPAPNRFCLIL